MADRFYWGKRGGGKTFGAVLECWLDYWDNREIWGNLHLHPSMKAKYFDIVDLITLIVKRDVDDKPKTLVLDEIHSQAKNHLSSSFINRNLSDFVAQARKFGFKIIYTSPILGGYEKNMRDMTDEIIKCKPVIDYNDIGLGTSDYPEPVEFTYTIFDTFDWSIKNQYSIRRKTARKFYVLYDTHEVITPAELLVNAEVKAQ